MAPVEPRRTPALPQVLDWSRHGSCESQWAAGHAMLETWPHFSLGTFVRRLAYRRTGRMEEETMDGLIYLVGLIVIIMAVLSLFGLR